MAENESFEAFRVDPTMLGGVGAPPGAAPAPAASSPGAAAGAEKADAGYPTIEAILSKRKNVEAFREQVAKSVEQLQLVAQNGTEAQKELAAKALKAYERLEAMMARAVALTIENIKRARRQAGR